MTLWLSESAISVIEVSRSTLCANLRKERKQYDVEKWAFGIALHYAYIFLTKVHEGTVAF